MALTVRMMTRLHFLKFVSLMALRTRVAAVVPVKARPMQPAWIHHGSSAKASMDKEPK